MPSCDASQLRSWIQHIQAAVAEQDWPRVQQLDALMQRWVRSGPLPAYAAAWREAADAHAQALQACQSAKEEVAQQLRALQNNQEAQKAYAWQEALA